MKRILLAGLLIFGPGQVVSFAQTDDIYFNSADIEQQKKEDQQRTAQESKSRQYRGDNSSAEDYQTYNKSYDNDDYIDYDSDDYYYSTRINRFNRPFYNRGYYSSFNNPFWYDPFWSDPYWGWSPWARPGFSISFGFGAPYWSSYWGYQNWYGYPGFYSAWSYPYYAFGGYNSGYWDGYYAGYYNNYGYNSGRTITYGPRGSSNFAYNTRANGLKRTAYQQQPMASSEGPRSPLRGGADRSAAENTRVSTDRNFSMENGRNVRSSEDNRPVRGSFSRDNDRAAQETPAGTGRDMSDRRSYDRGGANDRPVYDRSNDRPVYDRGADRPVYDRGTDRPVYDRGSDRQPAREQPQREQPRSQQREQSQPRYEAPRAEPRYQAAPRMESPRMSAPSHDNNSGSSRGGRR
jgi:hypothetical protein